jgi:hypothetical protein
MIARTVLRGALCALIVVATLVGARVSGVNVAAVEPFAGGASFRNTGWNYHHAPFPEGELCDRDGSCKPFAKTRAERETANDPRRSLDERYADHAVYVKRVEKAAQRFTR